MNLVCDLICIKNASRILFLPSNFDRVTHVFGFKRGFFWYIFSVWHLSVFALQHVFVASEASHNKPSATLDKQNWCCHHVQRRPSAPTFSLTLLLFSYCWTEEALILRTKALQGTQQKRNKNIYKKKTHIFFLLRFVDKSALLIHHLLSSRWAAGSALTFQPHGWHGFTSSN